MSVIYINPYLFPATGIVTSGLIAYLNAGDSASYPGSGTTWTDLSGSGNTGTLVGGVGYSGDNGGVLTFDGSNDYVTITTLPSLSVFTVALWVYITVLSGERQIFYSNNDSVTITTAGNKYMVYTGSVNYGSAITINIWKYVTIAGNGTSIKLYLNDALDGSWTTGRTMQGGDTALGRHTSQGRYMAGRIGNFQVYNRELSSAEVTQNFNATRSRFGL